MFVLHYYFGTKPVIVIGLVFFIILSSIFIAFFTFLYLIIKKNMMKNKSRLLLLFLMAFLGIGAIGGGGALILAPDGEMLQMPLSMLEHSPFNNFLIPGIILFTVLGISPFLLIFFLIKKPEFRIAEFLNIYKDMHWSWTFTIYLSFALIIWLQVEMLMLKDVHWLHAFYMFFAVLLLLVSLLPSIRNQYKIKDKQHD